MTILALGDSLVQGYGLPVEQGFVPQLQAWLQDQDAQATIINAGVSGDTTAGGRAQIDWALTTEVDGLIVSLGGNDMLRGLDPQYARENLRQILMAATALDLPVLLIGIAAPTNYGAEYKQDFDGLYPSLATEFETLLYPNFMAALASLPDRTMTLAEFMQGDGIHPNAKGVALVVQDIAPLVVQLAERAGSER